jgi:hypothetical protein
MKARLGYAESRVPIHMHHLSRIGFELRPMNWFKDAGNLQPTLGFEEHKESRRFIRKPLASWLCS